MPLKILQVVTNSFAYPKPGSHPLLTVLDTKANLRENYSSSMRQGWPQDKVDKIPTVTTKPQNDLLVWKAVFGDLITSKTSFNHTGSLGREDKEK